MQAPFWINLFGDWLGTQDENGNNWSNFLILYWEKNGVWGLAQHYNLFNFDGWNQVWRD